MTIAACFGFRGETLEVKARRYDLKKFLLFPHPSGVNLWWNDPFNRFRAEKNLRDFVLPK